MILGQPGTEGHIQDSAEFLSMEIHKPILGFSVRTHGDTQASNISIVLNPRSAGILIHKTNGTFPVS